MKKRSAIPILVTLVAPFLIAAMAGRPLSPDPCGRTANVPAKNIAAELTRVTNLCSTPYCQGNWTCPSDYSPPQPLWSGHNEKTFTIAEQDTIIKAANQAGSAHTEMCGKVVKRIMGYKFKTVPVGTGPHSDLAIMVTISYAVCGGMPN